ncbi:nitroreductase family protein [Qiania dongpingensis]|uniref:Nitroreductase family protein n=1 Tax=Qiania dongpingensis TaxID=2763669 RepID=A0A7G9G3I1_9FIRM|nr:nitroreductase family protein [Qiania dongpingensis]QNM05363.1 nitroreductase family protein [Qiania dongpingensis]
MLDLLLRRRSCRKFEDKAVEAEKKEKLLQAAQLAPTGKGTRSWEFVVIENKDTLQKLGNCRNPKQPFLPVTPLAIVVLSNTQKTDTWIEDAAIASVIIQLEAESLGLGSCWAQIRLRESNQEMSSEDYVRKLLGIPEHMAVLSIIAVGYPEKTLPAHSLEEVEQEKIHREFY